jgi:hypothetical protein
MPIFFLVGGYASCASLALHRASGGDGIAAQRWLWLLAPAAVLAVLVAVFARVELAARRPPEAGSPLSSA